MDVITVTEARARLPELLDRVEKGEEFTITRHGQPVAEMTRPDRVGNPRTAQVRAEARELRRQLEEARHKPLPEGRGLSTAFAEDLIAEARAGRDARS